MSRNYKFHNSEGLYFVSFAVVGWLDVFTRNEYKDLIVESLEFCQNNKGMEIHAPCCRASLSRVGHVPEMLVFFINKVYK